MKLSSLAGRIVSPAAVAASCAAARENLLHPRRAAAKPPSPPLAPGRFAVARLLPLTALAAFCAVIGMTVVGYPMPGGWVRFPLLWDGLIRGLLLCAFLTGGILLAGIVAAALAPSHGGRNDAPAGVAAVGTAAAPLLAAFALALFPPATPLIPLAGIPAAWLLSLAAPPFLGIPRERAGRFALLTAVAAAAIGVAGWVLYRLIASGGELGSI